MQVQEDMTAHLKQLGISYETYAKMLFRDVNTVKKTLNPEKGNPTLDTLYKYAAVLGGEIVFLTAEAKQAMQDYDISALNESLKATIAQAEAAEKQLAGKDEMIENLTRQVEHLAKQLATKDDMLNRLLNKYVLAD